MVETYPTIGWVSSTDDLNVSSSITQTTVEWLESSVSNFGPGNISAEFRKATKPRLKAQEAKLLTRLMDLKWPKVCDKTYLNAWDHRIRVAPNRPSTRLQTAKAASVRTYLDEHKIPYGDKR